MMAVFQGNSGNDTINAGAESDSINAGEGANLIQAGEGNNAISAGAGNDTVTAGSGDDSISVGEGSNRVTAGAGNNSVSTGSGADTITSGNGNDNISAGEGANLIDAGAGANNISAGSGADTITSGNGNDNISAGEGANAISAGDGFNNISTGSGADTITSGNGNDNISAGDGNNRITAGAGENVISTGIGADSISTGAGNDVINAGEGNNTVDGGDGRNIIVAGSGNDIVTTGSGDDTINVGNGNNTVTAGAGNNWIAGGVGNNSFTTLGGNDSLYGGNGNAVLSAGGGSDYAFGGTGNDVFIHRFGENAGARDYYEGSIGRDTLRLEFTQAEWARADVQADIARFLAHLGSATNQQLAAFGQATEFNFASMGLRVGNIESLEVVVAGVAIDPRNDLVTAVNDRVTTTEDSGATVDLLSNDIVPDRVVAIDLLNPSTLGTVSLARALDGAVQSATLAFAPSPALQALRAGEVRTETLTYRVTDANGDTGTATVTITVTGVNDAASIAGLSVGSVTEDTLATAQGQLTVTDIDRDEAVFRAPATLDGTYGSFTLDPATGQWSYHLDAARAAVQGLTAGQVVDERLVVTTLDGTASREIVVTIIGTNDTPTVTAATAAVAEDAVVAGQVIGADVDTGETATLVYALTSPAPVGLTFNADGSYSFDADSYDHLAAGETLTVFADFTATDAQGSGAAPQRLSITITGTNDLPTVTAATAAVAEDAVVTGQVTGADVDTGETATLVYSLRSAAPVGLTFNADGSYSFDASSYDHLAAGETLTVFADLAATDAQGDRSGDERLSITITGTNDIPVVTAATTSVAEDAVATGRVTGTDVDTGETASLVYALASPAPVGLTFNADGSYSFDASSYDSLTRGETLTVFADFTATDAQGATSAPERLAITIVGTNDIPTVERATVVAAEDSVITGQIVGADADAGETATLVYTLASPAPTGFTLAQDGSFRFDAGSYDSLAQGQVQALNILVRATDVKGAAATQTLTINVTGTNDAPVANNVSLTGGLTVNSGFSQGFTGWTIIPGPQTGPNGETMLAGTYSYTATIVTNGSVIPGDPAVADLSFSGTLTRFNDGPNIGTIYGPSLVSNTFGGLAGDKVSFVYRAFAGGDDASITAVLVNTQTGVVTPVFFETTRVGAPSVVKTIDIPITQSGVYQIKFTVGGFDATDGGFVGARLAIGTAGITRSAVLEDGQRVFDAIAFTGTATDPDQGAQLSVAAVDALSLNGAAVSIDASGKIVYDASALDFLRAGQTITDSFSYTITDQFGAQSTATATVQVEGANDAPVIGALSVTAQEGAAATFAIPGIDPDSGETASLRYASVGTLPAGLSVSANGVVSFNPGSQYESLRAGEQQTLNVTVTATDVNGAVSAPRTLNLTVIGENDAPVVTGQTITVLEDATYSGQLVGSDVDSGETASLVYSLVGPVPTGLVLNADGTFTFDASSYDALALGQTGTVSVQVIATDVNGVSSAPEVLTFAITGTNDTPEVASASVLVQEDGAVTGQLSGSDAEDGTALTYAVTGAAPAGLTLNSDGSFSFDASGYDSLPQGVQQQIVVDVTATDSNGAVSAPAQLQITVEGVNDAATIGGTASATLTEDTNVIGNALQATGQLVVTDADTGEAAIVAQSNVQGSAGLGSFTVGTNGVWTYTVDNLDLRVQALTSSQTLVDTLTVQSADGTATQQIAITIGGRDEVFTGSSGTNVLTAQAAVDTTLIGNEGSDTLTGSGGNDRIYGDRIGDVGTRPVPDGALTATAASYYTGSNNLVRTLGGTTGFGEGVLPRGDDFAVGPVDLTPIFGSGGLNFFGQNFTSLFVSSNGYITFGAGSAVYSPITIAASGQQTIALLFSDIDTRAGAVTASAGGTSTGSNLIYYDVDSVNGVFTMTLDDVGQFFSGTTPNAAQLQIVERDNGNFDIILRYEAVNWTGGARAGYTNGTTNTVELPGSGTGAVLDYDTTAGNTGLTGIYVLQVRDGVVTTTLADQITGGLGADTMTGGLGADEFIYRSAAEGNDRITDFISGIDRIVVSASGFGGGLVAGAAAVIEQVGLNGTPAGLADPHFIFEVTGASQGALLWDADGGDPSNAELIAVLDGVTSFQSGDLLLVG